MVSLSCIATELEGIHLHWLHKFDLLGRDFFNFRLLLRFDFFDLWFLGFDFLDHHCRRWTGRLPKL